MPTNDNDFRSEFPNAVNDNSAGGPPSPPPPDGEEPQRGDDRPLIAFNNRRLEEVVNDCLDAIKHANKPPKLFQQGTILTRIRRNHPGVSVEPLTLDSLRGFMERSATFGKVYPPKKDADGPRIYPGPVPLDFVRDIMALPEWSDKVFPRLKAVATCPVFARDGHLIDCPGYDPDSELWYEPDPNMIIDPIPQNPTDEHVASARRWLLDEYLVDFPFQNSHDRADSIAFMLTPSVRQMITGPTPLGLIEAPVAGTGKGLLAKAIALPSMGQIPEITPQVDNDSEWRKVLTSRLVDCPPFVILDNLTGTLKSGALEAALTCEIWADRELGYTRILRLPVNNCWLATGNNVQIAGDLPRRIVGIRLDAKIERPEERDPNLFRHKDLLKWGLENRGKLVWSCLVLVQAWIARDKPLGNATMGSYESWAAVLGGILKVAGIEGFLTNVSRGRRDSDGDLAQLRAFCLVWVKAYGEDKVGVKDLFTLLEENEDLLPQVTSAPTPLGRKQKLGHYLKKVRDRCVGDFQIIQLDGEDRSGRKQYRLKDLKAKPTTPTCGDTQVNNATDTRPQEQLSPNPTAQEGSETGEEPLLDPSTEADLEQQDLDLDA